MLLLAAAGVLLGCGGKKPELPSEVEILTLLDTPVIHFAQQELAEFLQKTGELTVRDTINTKTKRWRIVLQKNASLAPFSFQIQHIKNKGDFGVLLKGHDETCVLHAVYTLLEQVGYVFEISGPIVPPRLEMANLLNRRRNVQPFVLNRGIRQHLNFPMDISGYALPEAKAYIKNLARLRFNTITFHSYPHQWIPGPQAGTGVLAGRFFYGRRYDIPQNELFKSNIRNQKVFCIPEIEPFYDQPEKRSRLAVAWLAELMAACQRMGLTVRFSFEPRDAGTDVDKTLRTCETIFNLYPDIDTLELITEETGPWGAEASEASVRHALVTHFGEPVLKLRPVYDLLKPGQRRLDNLIGQLGHNISAARALRSVLKGTQRITVGVYCVVPEYLEACLVLMRRAIPEDIGYAVLPAHSGMRVVDYLRQVETTRADWLKSTMYSWIEFDGMMYLQQNGTAGIRLLLEDAHRMTGYGPVPSINFNHWRTSENRVPARYAALAGLYGPQNEGRFYRNYAGDLNIGRPRLFSRAMQELDLADRRTTNELPNAGFCYLGCWKDGNEELGYLGKFDKDRLEEIGALYREILDEIKSCAVSTTSEAGQFYLAFLENRLECTVLYLQALQKAVELQPLCIGKKPGELSEQEKKQVVDICNQSLLFFEKYLRKHAEMLPDRGCEGTMISLYHTPVVHVKRMRARWGGVELDSPYRQTGGDAPPSPIKF